MTRQENLKLVRGLLRTQAEKLQALLVQLEMNYRSSLAPVLIDVPDVRVGPKDSLNLI